MQIVLNSGREIILSSIYQNHTYSGLLCGYPNKKMNDMNIKKAMRSARNKMDSKATYLVPPPLLEVKIDDSVKQFYADEEVMRIPSITCYAQFESSSIKWDKGSDASCLTIVWYQDDFALPIDESVVEHIKAIDWDNLAEGYQF